MNLADILRLLQGSGVTLALEGSDGLRINAPRGAVTPDLRQLLLTHKTALLHLLRDGQADSGAALPSCSPDPDALYQPFALSDLQMGFYMADDPYMEFHVRPHYYIEKDSEAFDPQRYEAAWNQALQRHHKDIVVVRADGLLQTVADPAPLPLRVHDWRHLDAAAAQAGMAAVRAEMMRAELPIHHWPWLDLRVSLWTDGTQPRARIHYNHNNFFSDGYGTTRLLQEVQRALDPGQAPLPPLQLSFRDAALALDRLAASDSGQAARRYWEERLPGLPAAVPLPQRAGMDRRCRSKLQRREGFLPAAAWARLKQRARDAGLTPSSAVFAAYAELLACWSNSRHFLLSNMMTRRLNLHPEMREIVGNFASLYPLEVDLRDRSSFRDSALRLQEQVIRDSRHTHWGGMKVMQALNHRSHSLGSAPVPFVVGSGLFMDGFERSDFSCLETSQVMLDHQFWELGDGRLYYVWDLLEEQFPPGLVDDMAGAYAGWLQALADSDAAWQQADADLLPRHQRESRRPAAAPQVPPQVSPQVPPQVSPQVPPQVSQVPPQDKPRPAPRGLGELLPAAGLAHGEHTAVVCGSQRLSFAGLLAGAQAVAAALAAAGVAPGQRVAVVAERGAAWLQAVHGAQLAGATHVPIDPAMPMPRLALMLSDCGAALLLTTRAQAGRDWPAGQRLIVVDDGALAQAGALPQPVNGPQAAIGPQALAAATTAPQPDSLAYLIYTSGSTGRPKGVMIDHRGVMNTLQDINRRFGVGPQDRLFGVSSIGFDLSVYDVFGAAAAGASVVYPEPEQALNPAHWLDLLCAEGVTLWNSAPPLAVLLVEAAVARGITLPALRLVLLSGDWIPLDLPQRLRAIAPQARVVSLGGATEASIWSIAHEINSVDPAWPSIPYGRALDGQHWQVLDAQGRDLPDWVPGELYIGGIGLAQGYWNDPAKTAAAFAPHPRSGQRLYRTGDIGRWLPGGVIEFMGRRDAQVKVQGHRIELGEIEAALAAHPAVAAAVVLAHGGGVARAVQLVAYVVAQRATPAQDTPDAALLTRYLSERLPRYMLPAHIVLLAQLPLSANGKTDRRALQEMALPDAGHAAAAGAAPRPLRPPADSTEATLLALWSRVLGRDITEVGHDFFDQGGHSFEAVRLVGLISEAFGSRLSLGDLWQHRDIEAQAALLQRQGSLPFEPLRTLSAGSGDGATPLYLVHPAGGQVLCYRHLAAQLQRPVLAFEAAGVAGGRAPLDSVPAMAAQYAAALQAHQPAGPLLLGGWSSGAPIAFEMAALLRRQGRCVSGLVLIDSPAPAATSAARPPADSATLLGWFVEDLNLPAPTVARAREAAQRLAADGGDALARLAALAQALAPHGQSLGAEPAELATMYRTFEAIVRATAAYRAAWQDLPLLLLRADSGVVSEFAGHADAAQPAWGWQHCSPALQVQAIAGSHHSVLLPAGAALCARAIEDWLAAAPLRQPASPQPVATP